MTTDERLEALVVTVENLAGMAKDMLGTQDKHERQIEFLLQSQAKHDAQIERLTANVDKMETQAEADRQETRKAINAMLTIAEEMKQLAIGLTKAQQGTTQRVTNLESRVDAPEKPPQP